MTSLGRGRGWADRKWLAAKLQDPTLRRPGLIGIKWNPNQVISEVEKRMRHVRTQQTLSGKSGDESSLNNFFEHMIEENLDVRGIIQKLYDKAIEDPDFGITLATVFNDYEFSVMPTTDEKRIRHFILQILQKSYEQNVQTYSEDWEKFRNAVSFFGEIHYHMRDASKRPLTVLGLPLITYLKHLLKRPKLENLRVVATQLARNGPQLLEARPLELEQLFIEIRSVLVERCEDAKCKGVLLFILDLANQRYVPMHGDLQEFYVKVLGEQTFMNMQQACLELTIITEPFEMSTALAEYNAVNTNQRKRDIDNSESSKSANELSNRIGILMRAPESENSSDKDASKNKSEIENSSKIPETNIPRAIRGSGRASIPKEESKNKGWGHDDRFEKDYE